MLYLFLAGVRLKVNQTGHHSKHHIQPDPWKPHSTECLDADFDPFASGVSGRQPALISPTTNKL